MKQEIEAAARWFANLLRSKDLGSDQIAKFESTLIQLLTQKYTNHWYTTTPWRGQGYRSIIIDEYSIDKVLKKAARAAEIYDIHKRMPSDSFVMWVDPGEVEVKYLKTSRSEVVYSSSNSGERTNNKMWQHNSTDVHRFAVSPSLDVSSLRVLQRSPVLGEDEDKLSANERPSFFFDHNGGTVPGLINRPRSATGPVTDRHDRPSSLYNSNLSTSVPSDGTSVRFVKDVTNARMSGASSVVGSGRSSIWDSPSSVISATPSSTGSSAQKQQRVGSTPTPSSKLNLHARPFFADRKSVV